MKMLWNLARICGLGVALVALASCGGGGTASTTNTAAAADFTLPNVISAVPPQD